MKHKLIKTALLLLAVMLLSGCNIRTVDKLYLLPERSDAYKNLQSLINQALSGREYSAPISGENRQSVQMVDLDGDGVDEFLLFARGSAEKPLPQKLLQKTFPQQSSQQNKSYIFFTITHLNPPQKNSLKYKERIYAVPSYLIT